MNWGFISQKTTFFIVTAVKTSNLTSLKIVHLSGFDLVYDNPKEQNIVPACIRYHVWCELSSIASATTTDKMNKS
jgi:hypothetical protein